VLPWNLRQLISYFFTLIIYSINLLKTVRKTFATGNAIYPLPRTIIQITNDNSIFRKEGISRSLYVKQQSLVHLSLPLSTILVLDFETQFGNFLLFILSLNGIKNNGTRKLIQVSIKKREINV
jgi:hypothetical protein